MRNTPAKRLKLSNISREIIYLFVDSQGQKRQKNKMKEAENEVGYKLKMIFQECFSIHRREKLWKQMRSKTDSH